MACIIKRKDIDENKAKVIYDTLKLLPKAKSKHDKVKKNHITLYKRIDDDIHLPYCYASALFDIYPNDNIEFPKINIEFITTLRDYQIPVEEQIYNIIQDYGSGILGVYPGFGKTMLGASITCKLGYKTAILVPRVGLCEQWEKTFKNATNAITWIFGEQNQPINFDVIIINIDRCTNITSDILDSIGFLIIDEAHMICTRERVKNLFLFHPKFILAETASLERNDDLHNIMYAFCGTKGVFLDYKKPYELLKIKTFFTPESIENANGKLDYPHLEKTLFSIDDRNIYITSLVINHPYKSMILTSHQNHVYELVNKIRKQSITCDFLCGTKQKYNDSRVLIGTWQKIGTGFDEATKCDDFSGEKIELLILVTSIQLVPQLIQNVGRVFRADFPKVIVLVDNHNVYNKHWTEARKWYIKSGANIKTKLLKKEEFDIIKEDVISKEIEIDNEIKIEYDSNGKKKLIGINPEKKPRKSKTKLLKKDVISK